MHISSIYAKILGKTNFHAWEFPQSGSKGKNGDRERERDRKLVITMASYALQRHLGWRTQSRLGQKKVQELKRCLITNLIDCPDNRDGGADNYEEGEEEAECEKKDVVAPV